jgi:hypothetical protein
MELEDEDEEEEENSPSDLEASTDDEAFDPSPSATKRGKMQKGYNSYRMSIPTASRADTNDPPPPYEK